MYTDVMKPQEFDAVYRLLEESFPLDEYRPYTGQKALLDNAVYTVYVLRDERDAVIGMLALWDFDTFAYIEHFAVAPSARNRGCGSDMLKKVLKRYKKRVCLEVEPPDGELTRRRIRFYERNGFCFNGYPYIQPPISKGRNPIPLHIMTTDGAVEREAFDDIKTTLYREVYRCDENAY